MTFLEADNGRSNPKFKLMTEEFMKNCQSCVVAHEARIRGYNVQAAPRDLKNTSKSSQLARNSSWAWIDPTTNKKCEETKIQVNSAQECFKWLDINIKQGERYHFTFYWQAMRNGKMLKGGHIVTIDRDNMGMLRYYDPQINSIYYGQKIINRLNRHIIYNNEDLKPRILRVDDKKFNPYFMNDVLLKY